MIILRVEQNLKALVSAGVEFSVFEPTSTGIKKSILDATQPVRIHFELTTFHDYANQIQGPIHKVKKQAYLLTPTNKTESVVSLYRPVTKLGDPRMWFSKLPEFADAGDQIAIVIFGNSAYLLNLSKLDLTLLLSAKGNQVESFISLYQSAKSSIAEELLGRLRELSQTPFATEREGSTGIGFTLEKKLGITANSSKLPDYKGIEIKSGRGGGTRTTLFAQVADWSISPCKSSADILNAYGYTRDDHLKLYCTINAVRPNTQGLLFIYDANKDQLQEWHNNEELVAIWPGALLRKRLLEKHTETFWIDAESTFVDGVEHFQLKNVTHTRAPIVSQLVPLIVSGAITMDHLIKRNDKTSKVSEKGPLFKINKKNLELLFPKPVEYKL